MKIIFGCGKNAERYISKNRDELMLCYDNDRRKWGQQTLCGIKIISLDKFLNLIKSENCEIIVTPNDKTALYFIKDVCNEQNKIYQLQDDKVVPVNLNELPEYSINMVEVEENKIHKYEVAKQWYKEMGYNKAYEHACQYIEYKKNYLYTPEIGEIEITNYCNLKCPNCPTPTCKRSKGYMSEQVFEGAIKYIAPDLENYFTMHGLGEPLLHPKFFTYLERITEIKRPVLVSTNGILLEEETIENLLSSLNEAPRGEIFVSFHTEKSIDSWERCVKWIEKNESNKVKLYGQVLDHNKEQALMWLTKKGIKYPEENKYIRFITSHSFAGNVIGRKHSYLQCEVDNRFRNCFYNRNNIVSMAWDGRLKSCCLDSEVIADIGDVFNIKNIHLGNNAYKLCQTCDPDWTSNFQ